MEFKTLNLERLTVLASLVLVITESTVQCCELSELVALEFVLALRNGSGLSERLDSCQNKFS